MTALRETVRRLAAARPAEAARAHAWLVCAVRSELAPRKPLVAAVREELEASLPALDGLDDALVVALSRLDPGPFRAEMTVHAAHARDPRAQAVFARRGLPGCPDCAVGADETLAQAAQAEGFSLSAMLDELRELES
ncbi:hypothetical protein LBMAG42_06780 [Deltaproteobacteria bacterium]|nr:hypothetical protein LBMAG42_06780 [Deltaproteobacteria bacterium]